jgi:hypothetical protein
LLHTQSFRGLPGDAGQSFLYPRHATVSKDVR